MDSFKCYQEYISLKLHFTKKSYDYFRYRGNCNKTEECFNKRNDKYFFVKLAKQYNQEEIRDLFVANFLENESFWVGDDNIDQRYLEYRKNRESRKYIFKLNLIELSNYMNNNNYNLNDILITDPNRYPILYDYFQSTTKDITLDTLIIMDKVLNFLDMWNICLQGDNNWDKFYNKVLKYKPFIGIIHLEEYKKVMQSMFLN